MAEDARFEDGGEKPIHLKAHDAEDLQVISALCQDAIVPMGEISYDAARRCFAMLLNRFRWEDVDAAQTRGRDVERVQAVLIFEDVTSAQSLGLEAAQKDMVLSLMAIDYAPAQDGTGRAQIVLAGDGAIALELEAINVTLRDVTRPYVAPSKSVPQHEV